MTDQASLYGAPYGHMLSSTIQTLAEAPGSSPDDVKTHQMAAAMALGALEPGDAFETLAAARAVASHYAAMDCYRRAARPEVSDLMVVKLFASAGSLARLVGQTAKGIERRKAMGVRGLRARAAPAADPAAEADGGQHLMSREAGSQPADPRAHAAGAGGGQHPMPSENGPVRPGVNPSPHASLNRHERRLAEAQAARAARAAGVDRHALRRAGNPAAG